MKPIFRTRMASRFYKHDNNSKFFPYGSGFGIEGLWPFSKLEIYADYLIIKTFGKQFKLDFKDIDYIQKEFWGIKIHHHSKSVQYGYVLISGIFTGFILFKEIKEIVSKYKLRLKIKE